MLSANAGGVPEGGRIEWGFTDDGSIISVDVEDRLRAAGVSSQAIDHCRVLWFGLRECGGIVCVIYVHIYQYLQMW